MKKKFAENYLERIPVKCDYRWTEDDKGIVTLEIDNKGIFNTICQKLFKKPKVTYIHLDEIGSFVWPLIDGNKTILDLGKDVEKRFGENANPLYERLAKYFQILDSYGFIRFK